MSIFAIPALIREAIVRTRTPFALRVGGDTVSKVVSPVFTFWRICFIRSDANQGVNRQIWVERLERVIRFFRDTIQCPLIARRQRFYSTPDSRF